MKQVIKGKRYDTDTAKYIAETSSRENGIGPSNFNFWSETLYQKRTGEFFLFGEGGPMSKYSQPYENNGSQSGCKIIPLTFDQAKQWAEKALDADEYETLFGPVEEDSNKHVMLLSVNESTYQIIKRLAVEKQISMSQVVNDWAKNN